MADKTNVVPLREDLTPHQVRRLRDELLATLKEPVGTGDRHLGYDLVVLAHKIDRTAMIAGAIPPSCQRKEPGEYSQVDRLFSQLYFDVEQLIFKAQEYDYNARRAAAIKRESKKRAKRLAAKKLVG
jgi:hypothetical protein